MVYGSQHNVLLFLLLSILPPQRPTRTARLVPYTTHFRSEHARLSYSDRRAAVKTAALNRARFWGRLWPLCPCPTRRTIWSVRDRKGSRLNSSHECASRTPSSVGKKKRREPCEWRRERRRRLAHCALHDTYTHHTHTA